MYILKEVKDNGDSKEYSFETFEEAQALLNEKAEADKAAQVDSCDILHGDDIYNRVTHGTQKSYYLKIEGLNNPNPTFDSISF